MSTIHNIILKEQVRIRAQQYQTGKSSCTGQNQTTIISLFYEHYCVEHF